MAPTDTFRNGEREREQESHLVRQSSKCYEHRESQATAMTVDYTGEWALLAGRRHLSLQRLSQEDGVLRKYATNSKYKVSAAEFAICPASKEACAIATSQHIDVVTWGASDPRYIHSLRAHTRMVTDIDWHGKNPYLLVSCSIDTFSHIWDLRDSRKPTLSLSAVCMSGATQVGFNRVSGNLLAAAHDGDLRIWDIRKGSCPIHYITAHLNRVHGINWSHRRETCLATASQDGTVKYFDISNPRRAEKIITASSPVWRARYTPIGNGLVSIVVPHLGRGENSLLLWSNSKQYDPVCSFTGHTDVILDFAWRPNHQNTTEIELVTWSRDRTLRVWKIDEHMLRLCEPEGDLANDELCIDYPGEQPTPINNETPRNSIEMMPHKTESESRFREEESGQSHGSGIPRKEELALIAHSMTDQATCALHHEFSLLNPNMPHVEINLLDAIKRCGIFKISAGGHTVMLETLFPLDYPSPNTAPEFSFGPGTTLHDHLNRFMLKLLRNNALQRVKKSRTCLEQCLRALVTALKKVSGGFEKLPFRLQSPRLEGALSGALHDACIPFPRTSAVAFNIVGLLCTFSQALKSKRLTLRHQNMTPRTLSAINGGGLLGNVMGPQPVLYTHRDSNTTFYIHDRMISSKHLKSRSSLTKSHPPPNAFVLIYECHRLLHISRELATELSVDQSDIRRTCRQNRRVCEQNGRPDLMPIWTLAEMIATPNIPLPNNNNAYTFNSSSSSTSAQPPIMYNSDPYRSLLLEELIMHFAQHGDLQTAVILACLFHKAGSSREQPRGDGQDVSEEGTSAPTTPAENEVGGNQQKPVANYSFFSSPSSVNVLSVIKSFPKNTMLYQSAVTGHTDMSSNAALMALTPPASLLLSSGQQFMLINPHKIPLYDQFKKVYSEVLYGWKLLITRTLILKHTMLSKAIVGGVEFVAECPGCNKTKRTPSCASCQRRVFYCSLCGLPVKGAANACLACGHGGHLLHMMQWFKDHKICASGCGCQCLQKTSNLLEYLK